ncbi:hypothetical protein B4589_005840 [Halolamina sp. CBA1230]|uniref:hypothetical protein n=1 Tax=Halolamina sp. CBA1230 TaxID=1853690 RepID=UPI0009A23F8C|nr:hypothetical protein [Halolamina sp. CBA1230]QKY19926.1 hypothetical protein B4589_005840 [Halolamina sp. CBA1230]
MVEFGQLAFGVFMVLGGALLAIDHPIVDWLNRWMKSWGTTREPEDIEMDENAALVGFVGGAFTVIVGLMVVVDATA